MATSKDPPGAELRSLNGGEITRRGVGQRSEEGSRNREDKQLAHEAARRTGHIAYTQIAGMLKHKLLTHSHHYSESGITLLIPSTAQNQDGACHVSHRNITKHNTRPGFSRMS